MESSAEKKDRTKKIIEIFQREFPDAACPLTFQTPLELLIKSILSAQCKDERVNKVGMSLFQRYRSVEDFAEASVPALEGDIRSAGLYRRKAQHIQKSCAMIVERFGRAVPRTMDELRQLPGVGRKIANVVLGNGFGVPALVVDTHVIRLARLLRLTAHRHPEKIERDLVSLIPEAQWIPFSHWMAEHGRKTCVARRPKCAACALAAECPSALPNLN
jgi:endonuclease-3